MGEKSSLVHDAETLKWWHSLYSAIIFFVIANPMTYKLVNKVLGKLVKISDGSGCATQVGVLVHSVVFLLIIRFMM